MLPRLCDESSKFLCVQRDCQCDFGTKEKCLGFGGEDPNQCILQEQKMLCCVNAADCYCEGLCLPDGTCIRTKADCFCRKEEKSVGGLQEGKCCCIRNTATFKLEPPLDKQNVCVRASNRCCCMFCRDLCK